MTNRDLGAELLEAVREIKRGGGRRYVVEVPRDVPTIRQRTGLSQSAFAALLGVSVRTLQDWEQGRRHPTGPALALLRVADRHPRALVDRTRRTRAEAGGGAMGQHRSFTITTARRPAGLPPPTNGQELWLQVTAGLAAVAGIADVDRLRHALSVGLANREWVESQGCVVEMPGGQCLLISGETAEQLAKLGDLGDQFVAVLRETKWPREILPELTPVEFALSEFDRWLYGLAIRPQQKSRGRNKSLIGVLIQSLAKAWPDLTGEKAMVYPNGIDGEVRGRFYSFVQQACVTFKLACPSPSTVQRFLNPDKRRREAESRKTKSHR